MRTTMTCLVMLLGVTPLLAAPTLKSISIQNADAPPTGMGRAAFDDWIEVFANPANTIFDGDGSTNAFCPPLDSTPTDLDCSVTGGVGRDLYRFSWTYDWDGSAGFVYLYLERWGSGSSSMEFYFAADMDGPSEVENGTIYLDPGDRVIHVGYQGTNGVTGTEVCPYKPSNPTCVNGGGSAAGCDPLNSPVTGFVDGFDLAGTAKDNCIAYTQPANGGDRDPASPNGAGTRFEVRIPWSMLSATGPRPVYWHVVSNNSNQGSLAGDDNLGNREDGPGSLGSALINFSPASQQGGVASPGSRAYGQRLLVSGLGSMVADFKAESTQGFRLEFYRDDDGDGNPATGNQTLMAVDNNGDGDFADAGDQVVAAFDTPSNGFPNNPTPLASGQSYAITLVVVVPAGANEVHDTTTLTATTTTGERATATITTSVGAVTLLRDLSQSGVPGGSSIVPFHLRAQNNTATPESINISAVDLPGDNGPFVVNALRLDVDCDGTPEGLLTDSPADADTTVDLGTVPAGAERCLTVEVLIPGTAVVGNVDRLLVTASLASDPNRLDTVTLETQVRPRVTVVPAAIGSDTAPVSITPGSSRFFSPFTVVNSASVATAYSVCLDFRTPEVPYVMRLWTDPNGDGNPSDGQLILVMDAANEDCGGSSEQSTLTPVLAPFGGSTTLLVELEAASNRAFGELLHHQLRVDRLVTPTAVGEITTRSIKLGIFGDADLTNPQNVFAACDAIVLAGQRLTATTSNVYQLQVTDSGSPTPTTVCLPQPSTVSDRTCAAPNPCNVFQPTDARGTFVQPYTLPAGRPAGTWNAQLFDVSNCANAADNVTVTFEVQRAGTILGPTLRDSVFVGSNTNANDVGFTATLSNTNSGATYRASALRYAILNDTLTTYWNGTAWVPFVDLATSRTGQSSVTALSPGQTRRVTVDVRDVLFPDTTATYNLAVDWALPCGDVIASASVTPLAVRPCAGDLDGDGCGNCVDNAPAVGSVDGDGDGVAADCDCNTANARCSTNCTDADNDTWCVGHDCNDARPFCQGDCTDADSDLYCGTNDCDPTSSLCTTTCVDVDGDLVFDCRDTCIDVDGDSYGVGTGCLGVDCNDANNHCDSTCVDGDGDGWCVNRDCQDTAATCTSDCTTNVDGDATPDCRDTCIDVDGDGYGAGTGCLGVDCNDANNHCDSTCVDGDGDGWCVNRDCQDTAATCTSDCTTNVDGDATPDCRDTCIDVDGDGYGLGSSCSGVDCNDTNPRCDLLCVDGDGDGWCVNRDCQDTAATCTSDCTTNVDGDATPDCRDTCIDVDGDNYGVGTGCVGVDCNDANNHCDSTCVDGDGDGWCVNRDCQDTAATCTSDCTTNVDVDATPDCRDTCIDGDGDGHGTAGGAGNTCTGADCDDTRANCDTTCVDGDADGYCVNRDCNDLAAACTANCAVDVDLDSIPDCQDTCIDRDGDGYGVGAGCAGVDCNDQATRCTTVCQDLDRDNTVDCLDDCIDTDGDRHGTGTACLGMDCDPNSFPCTVDCQDGDGDGSPDCAETCVDLDGDGYGTGPGCRGPDCDDQAAGCAVGCVDVDRDLIWDCRDTCLDMDGDGYGTGAGCTGGDCDDTSGLCTTSCADINVNTIPDCREGCTDADGDGYGTGAACLGADCDDTAVACNLTCSDVDGDSIPDCRDPCTDADGDGFGTGPGCTAADCDDTAAACTRNCVDVDVDTIPDCRDTCVDVDSDNHGTGTGCTAVDCDDRSALCTTACVDADADNIFDCQDTCQDLDGDGHGVGPGCTSADCDDRSALCAVDCSDANSNMVPDCRENCVDPDGDGYGTGTACLGADCDETSTLCRTTCVDLDGDRVLDCKDRCVDLDGDTFGPGPGCTAPDCDPANALCTLDCSDRDMDTVADCLEACVDLDGDSYGTGNACLGPDCDAASTVCRLDCSDQDADMTPDCRDGCVDVDRDGYGLGLTCSGADCNDQAASCTTNCAADVDVDSVPDCRDGCVDGDRDGFGAAGGVASTCTGLDCLDTAPECTLDCTDLNMNNTPDCAEPSSDDDNDGVSNNLERALGTNPNDADTDDDGITDGSEPSYAQDTDGDGLINALDPDSDDDGLLDGTESGVATPPAATDTARGNFRADLDPSTTTNPLRADSDMGGVRDGSEDTNLNGRLDAGERDPGTAMDDATPLPDQDGDGLSDALEAAIGSNPMDADSDDDGVLDGEEPNPSQDTDGDGLLNPLDPDSDNDALLDGTERGVTAAPASTDVTRGNFRPDLDPATRTSSLAQDSDRGGVRDGAEDENLNGRVDVGERDPQVRADDAQGTRDQDGDGLSDGQEATMGTRPNDGDSDDDGVLDGDEPNPSVDTDQDGTINTRDPDSDGDGLWDGTERGVTTAPGSTDLTLNTFTPDADPATRTNMLLADTDRGGVLDGTEDTNRNGRVDLGERDPLNRADDMPVTSSSSAGTGSSSASSASGTPSSSGSGSASGGVSSSLGASSATAGGSTSSGSASASSGSSSSGAASSRMASGGSGTSSASSTSGSSGGGISGVSSSGGVVVASSGGVNVGVGDSNGDGLRDDAELSGGCGGCHNAGPGGALVPLGLLLVAAIRWRVRRRPAK